MEVLCVWVTLMHPCRGVHRRMSLMTASLHLQQCLACFVCLTRMVCEMRGKWLHSCYFVGLAFMICSKKYCVFPHLTFSPYVSLAFKWCIYIVVILTQPQLGRSFVLIYQRSDFHMTDNLSIAVHAFPRHYAYIVFSRCNIILKECELVYFFQRCTTQSQDGSFLLLALD